MIDISTWMNTFQKILNKTFGDRVWFVGLQGSHDRGEATESIDIDVVVIVDTFMCLKNGDAVAFESMSEALFAWSRKWITESTQ